MSESWSKLSSNITDQFKKIYDINDLAYHNWDHVQRLYQWAQQWKVPYSIDLDLAIAAHDCIYDTASNNELRSADLMQAIVHSIGGVSKHDLTSAYKIVCATANHQFSMSPVVNYMIMLDLADFGTEFWRKRNSDKLLTEAQQLYPGASVIQIKDKQAQFLKPLRDRLLSSLPVIMDATWLQRGINIVKGINDQIIESHLRSRGVCL